MLWARRWHGVNGVASLGEDDGVVGSRTVRGRRHRGLGDVVGSMASWARGQRRVDGVVCSRRTMAVWA
jgi:hypothetical protein